MMHSQWMVRLRGQVALLEREAPAELQDRVRQLKRCLTDAELAVRREVNDLESEVARLRRFTPFIR